MLRLLNMPRWKESDNFLVSIKNFPNKSMPSSAIRNGNRTEWSQIRSVIIRVITKSDDSRRRPRSGSPICLSRVWLQTEWDNTKSYYQLPNHKNYNFRGKKNSQLMWQQENWHKKTDKGCINLGVCTLFLWWLKPSLWLVNLNYNFKCDWLI